MRLGEQLLLLMQSYADAVGVPVTTASKRATGTTNTAHRLRAGGAITDIRFDNAVRWFADHWPEATHWPEGVSRPRTGASSGAAGSAPAASIAEVVP
jgi:hypothetical protein